MKIVLTKYPPVFAMMAGCALFILFSLVSAGSFISDTASLLTVSPTPTPFCSVTTTQATYGQYGQGLTIYPLGQYDTAHGALWVTTWRVMGQPGRWIEAQVLVYHCWEAVTSLPYCAPDRATYATRHVIAVTIPMSGTVDFSVQENVACCELAQADLAAVNSLPWGTSYFLRRAYAPWCEGLPSRTPVPPATYTSTPTAIPTPSTGTETPLATPTQSISPTLTPTTTSTAQATTTPSTTTPTQPASPLTSTPTQPSSPVFTPTRTDTPEPIPTVTETATATLSPILTHTPTETVIATPSPTVEPTMTEYVILSPTATMTPTDTPTMTKTPTLMPTVTMSATPTATETIIATPTATITPTATPIRFIWYFPVIYMDYSPVF